MPAYGFRSSIKTAAVHGLHMSGLARASSHLLGVRGVILTFHEIHHDPCPELWTGCPIELFQNCITWLRKTGWDIVTLGEAIDRLHHQGRVKKFAVFTFDDGYRDNVVRALPILQRERVPFTIFVTTDAITRKLFAWWLGLRELFRSNERVDIAAMDRSFLCADLISKTRSLAVATAWVHMHYQRIPDLRDTFLSYRISLEDLCDRYFMNEDELEFLAQESLASIGAHTVTHPVLATLNAENALREMVDNRSYLQARSDHDVKDLAYPFGNARACGSREAQLAAQAGFRTAATTSNRPFFARDHRDLFTLPRISIHPHWTLPHIAAATGGLTLASVRQLVAH